ncbi:MAG TPA: hypothetical protein VJ697_07865 [Nitrososphaeraceae archaeon]|nr:hypothetical protein [Nitrososphaeraceae archaeon]
MKCKSKINYFFLILAVGIISTPLSSSIWAQSEGNSQNQTSSQGQQGAGTIEELQSLTTSDNELVNTTNDTTPMSSELGKETSTDQGFAGDKEQQSGQQQSNQTASTSGGQQQSNQTASTSGGQQQSNQTAGQQEQNKSGNPLSDVGKAIGELFK